MDIDLLSKMVKELILDNDRVVLPGLGSFVAEMVPSTFSDKGYTINPPYRKLFFRSKPDEGEMLVRFYAESNNVDPEMASRILRDFISELKSVLHTKKTVVFPGLGRLRATKENNLFFVADEDLDIFPAGFGLEPISLKTHVETVQDEPVTDSEPVVVEENTVKQDEPIDLSIGEDIIPEGWSVPEVQTETVAEVQTETVAEPVPAETAETIEPVQEAVPEAAQEIEPAPVPAELPEPETVTEQLTRPASSTSPAHLTPPALPASPVPPASAAPVSVATENSSGATTMNKVLKAILIVLICVVALLVIYVVVMRIFPDFLNGFLYTPEELEIINFK